MNEIIIQKGKKYKYAGLIHDLVSFGYERSEGQNSSGQFEALGDTIIISPVNFACDLKIEFFGDVIERVLLIRRSTREKIEEIEIARVFENVLKLLDKSILHLGDFVVHEDYGIGIYNNIETKKVDSEEVTYINISYLNNDLLRIPIAQIDKLSRYIGVGRKHPKLSRLGSVSWQKTYKKTYENVLLLARELLSIYAKRHISYKKPRQIHMDWDESLNQTFGFQMTDDQSKAIKSIFQDLETNIPTDRLICGDVGFGKTEVALRAAAQTIANGYQVAILVPTTILAEQHFITLSKRFQSLPVSVARLSRFVGSAESNEIIKRVEQGSVDLIIGTHKILRSKINFKNLGLLVVDEEQKFGVADKEHLKKFRENIDVLTLTATPIPRTLYMAISGIREISEIGSVPVGRKAIETAVKKYDRRIIMEYIDREIKRGGQAYYLHNEVRTIDSVKKWLVQNFPKLRIEIAHGQMGEMALAKTMHNFSEGNVDILVCSTIIENGLDLPNVNTIIVDESDHFGLSQLYQIRGRIGRSMKQSYALFTYRTEKLTQNSQKRLKALLENTELGTGYNIALSDLEIRGGGNILGREQHGNMEAVGLILYSKLLKLAVDKIKK